MAELKDGGPAFPFSFENVPSDMPTWTGMSLRDYFAGKALIGLLACDVAVHNVPEEAYNYADLMLAEREKSKEGS